MGRGTKAEWLGSVAWDGDPENFPEVIACTDEQTYRAAVQTVLVREDGTLPKHGWPWPWKNSQTTDFAIAFDGGDVYASCFGHAWYDPEHPPESSGDDEDSLMRGAKVPFPDMTSVQKVTLGKRSGVMVVGASGIIEPKD